MADLLKNKIVRSMTGLLISMGILFSLLPVTLADGSETAAETSTEAATAAPTEEVTQTRLENGSFEYPTVDGRVPPTATPEPGATPAPGDCMSSNGTWCVQPRDYLEEKALDRNGTGFYWHTTAFDDSGIGNGKIELGFNDTEHATCNYTKYGVSGPADDGGTQFAELCAEDQSSLYQNLKTDPGAVFNWSLCHAARRADQNNGTESMALFIGAKQSSPLYKKAKGINNNNDIFMWMAYLLKQTNKINIDTSTTQEGMIPLTVYSKSDINVQKAGITTDNYTQFFSLTPTGEITKEWKCWIITSEYVQDTAGQPSQSWKYYEGTYEIPVGQTETTFAFTALTGKNEGKDYINEGNLLDNIVFEKKYPLRVTTTAGGTGRVYTKFDPQQPDSTDENINKLSHTGEFVTAEGGTSGNEVQDHFDRYNDGTELWVRATPKAGYTFSGAFIDGAFHSATDPEYFTPITLTSEGTERKTYHQKIIMNKARFIQLIYTKDSTVIFDPNGGTYNGTTANTEVSMNADHPTCTTAPQPPTHSDGVNFIGWYIAPFPSYYSKDGNDQYIPSEAKGAMIQNGVTIQYQSNTGTGKNPEFVSTYHYAYGDMTDQRTATTDAADGLTFIAQWEYLQTAKAMTMEQTATKYVNSMSGGTVKIESITGEEANITGRTVTTLNDDNNGITNGGGGKISSGYARMKDKITMVAEPRNGYVFRGWYDEDTGERLSGETMLTYELGAGVRTIQARFRAILQYPYLSFVSKDTKPATTEKPFNEGSSLMVDDKKVDGYGGVGDSKYGNTISTGFSTVQTLNSLTINKCLWTITIPAPTAEKPLYVKSEKPIDGATEILANDGAEYNAGAIYKMPETTEPKPKEIKLRANLPEISGQGQAVFGVIIDNLYAPGATAVLELMEVPTNKPADEGVHDLDSDGSYTYNAGNEYTYNYYESSSTQSVP